VGWDGDVDLAARQAVLHKEPPVVLDSLLAIASLHKGVPQQHGEIMTVQAHHAQPTVHEGAVRVIFHLR
jgi:hypothetical protein